jgi:hypothetical protein
MRSAEADTVRDVTPSDGARALMDQAMRGEAVDAPRLVRELARMLELAKRVDRDFERLVVLARPPVLEALSGARPYILDMVVLPDGAALVRTVFSMSSAEVAAEQLALAGVPCFPASRLDVASAAHSFEEALELVGDAVVVP